MQQEMSVLLFPPPKRGYGNYKVEMVCYFLVPCYWTAAPGPGEVACTRAHWLVQEQALCLATQPTTLDFTWAA